MTKKKKIKLFLAPGRKAKKASAARQNPKTQFRFQTYEAGCNKVTFESGFQVPYPHCGINFV